MHSQNATPAAYRLTTPQHQLWTVEDVARFLQVSRSWVYKASSRGDLPCVRIGPMLRFDPAAIRSLGSVSEPPSATLPDGARR